MPISNDTRTSTEKLFDNIKKEILKIDPVSFAENYLTIDGQPMQLDDSAWKFLSDIYRYIAFEATSENGRPVALVKGRQTGATTMATAMELFFTTSGIFGFSPDKPPMRILHCFPALANVQKFVKEKLSTMMRTSVDNYVMKQSLAYDEKSGKRRLDVPDDTLDNKQFKGENKLWVDSNANNAVRLQGMTLDAIFYDEAQRMYSDDIGNSNRTLTAAHYGPRGSGIQLYFGTPLQRGSYFHKIWEASDQRFYHLGCEACSQYFRLYNLGTDDWEKVWLFGTTVECSHCKHQQDKNSAVRRGKWVPTKTKENNGGEEPAYVGFHFNQLLIPYFTKETILKEKPGIHPTNTDRIWKCEILGEFYSGSDLPMSEEEIYAYCRDPSRKLSFGIAKSTQINTFMGVDWGGKADSPKEGMGKSYSSVVVISVDTTGTIRVENAFKLKKNDFEHKKDVIDDMFRRFNIKIAVADLGYGNDIVPELQREYSSRILGCLNSGSLVNPYKYDPEDLRLICNPHIVLDDIFKLMRKSKILFPWQSFEQIQWLVEHCCSMEKEERFIQGQSIVKYVKGNTPNDGLMALLYAYVANKFYETKGFNIKPHLQGTKASINAPVLAYLPRM